jgi:hypothetical protein
MAKKVLFVVGSMNQTWQMHAIAKNLPEYDCWFSQFFTDLNWANWLIKHTPVFKGTIFSGQFKDNAERYLRANGMQIDYQAKLNKYDLVVYCSDLHIPKRMRQTKMIWVQEGMTDKLTWWAKVIKALGVSGGLAGGTALNGSSNICDVYCAGSEGYKEQFVRLGTDREKIVVTGIPNYDNIEQFLDNDFPHKDYVMVATTDMRETFRAENRPAFIRDAVKIANGRQLLFKLHPNENFERAEREIKQHAPAGTIVYRKGNTNHMIANCTELITQYSTVVYVGLALGKKVHSYFNLEELKRLAPLQNEGTSAAKIAEICRGMLGPQEKIGQVAGQYELEQNV